MVLLKSNVYPVIFKSQLTIYKYEIDTTPKVTAPGDHQQIIRHLETFEPNLVGTHNGFYTRDHWKHQFKHKVMLLKGEEILVVIAESIDQKSETELIENILNKIMINTKFLLCRILKSCYNPFEERNTSEGSQIPGFRLDLLKSGQMGIFIIPEILLIQKNSESLKGDVLVDVATGNFYNKSDVVKVQKELDLIHFRDKSVISKNHLKPIRVKPQIGYQLACALNNYYQRIQMTSSELLKYWGMAISSRPQDMQAMMIDPGFLTLQGVEKSLNNMIFPVTRSAYNEYYRSNFQICYEEYPNIQIYVCYKQYHPKVKILMDSIENIRSRMNIGVAVYKAEDWNISNFIPRPNALYLILTSDPQSLLKKQMRQSLVSSQAIYHTIDEKDLSEYDSILNEVTTLQHLGIICSKFRMAPWKLKNIPFTGQPISVVSVDIETSNSQHYSIAMTFSLNSFLSKFVSLIEQANKNEVEYTLETMLQTCILKFGECHRRFPMRVIMFVSSSISLPQSLQNLLQLNLSKFYASNNRGSIQFILVSYRPCPSLRLYSMKTNLLNPQTVKPAGLLSFLVFENKLCIQLQMHSQMTEFTLFHSSNDPELIKKMSELIVKLSLGSVDNQFGGGLGFLGYAKKLNRFRDVDLAGWKKMLMEGYMLYL